MTDQGFGVVRPLPGNGLVAHVGGLLLVCDAADAVASELLEAVRDTAATGGDGRSLARRAAQVLARSMTAEPVACAVAGPAGGGTAVLVSGDASATVVAEGGEVTLAGRDALTWTDRLVPGTVHHVELRLPGAGDPHPRARLDDGVVVGGGLACDAQGVRGPADRPVPASQEWPMAGLEQDYPPPEPVLGTPGPPPEAERPAMPPPGPASPPPPPPPATPEHRAPYPMGGDHFAQPGPPAPPMHAAPPGPTGPMPGPLEPLPQGGGPGHFGPGPGYGQPSDPFGTPPPGPAPEQPPMEEPEHARGNGAGAFPDVRDQPFEAVLLAPDQPEQGEPEAPAEQAEPDSRPLVYGVDCKNDHFNDPRVPYCAVCGIALVQRTLVPYKGPRPPLGVLLLDDGMTLRLDTDYLLGRDPERAAEVTSGQARPAKVTSPDGSVSRRHLRVALDGWDVNLVDLGSVNGTQIQPPGDPNFYDIPPNEPVSIAPGTTVRIGVSRTMRYESHRTR
ncbi:FHA domain-containing protein [Spongiactinospora sp. TRM90649]|uniref:FHA domain-containing protein n=1 Tax=Spongiactinospora sp. TRM90649 TaxID=3031114 RepID=UPI0023F62F4C|nr:FHA domain-containing protein [Spongiactinospora sp. TRM90649]MDF5753805.1 FHA domain-containing protein [Spongiactinospora sp. TRM90649]